ncbi:MAG: hypothetical protein ACKVWR_04655 [Acidimicrobiales bacterium]
MAGAIVLAVFLVVLMPVGVAMSGALAAFALGWSLKEDADEAAGDSVYRELNT